MTSDELSFWRDNVARIATYGIPILVTRFQEMLRMCERGEEPASGQPTGPEPTTNHPVPPTSPRNRGRSGQVPPLPTPESAPHLIFQQTPLNKDTTPKPSIALKNIKTRRIEGQLPKILQELPTRGKHTFVWCRLGVNVISCSSYL